MRGPCMSGYHVPTIKEWCDAIDSINGTTGCSSTATTTVVTTLQIPLSGTRDFSTSTLYNQGSFGYYWSSTPYSTYARNVSFNTSQVNPSNFSYRTIGFSLRCQKN
ncbi:hypothetical protein H7170_03600 [Candidatus Gracilibacteria bacterium]|nr:hypothetical protein [Candidatus Gracilibacteria bacterium]